MINSATNNGETKQVTPFEKRDTYTEYEFLGSIPTRTKTETRKEKVIGRAPIEVIRNGKKDSVKMTILDTLNFDNESFTNLTTNLYVNQGKNGDFHFNVDILPTCKVARETTSVKGVFKTQSMKSIGLMARSTDIEASNKSYGKTALLNNAKHKMVSNAKIVNKSVINELRFMEQFVTDAKAYMQNYRVIKLNTQGKKVSVMPKYYMNNCSCIESNKKIVLDHTKTSKKIKSNSNDNKIMLGFSSVCLFSVPKAKGDKHPKFIAFIRIGSYTYTTTFDDTRYKGNCTQANGQPAKLYSYTQTPYTIQPEDEDEDEEILLDRDSEQPVVEEAAPIDNSIESVLADYLQNSPYGHELAKNKSVQKIANEPALSSNVEEPPVEELTAESIDLLISAAFTPVIHRVADENEMPKFFVDDAPVVVEESPVVDDFERKIAERAAKMHTLSNDPAPLVVEAPVNEAPVVVISAKIQAKIDQYRKSREAATTDRSTRDFTAPKLDNVEIVDSLIYNTEQYKPSDEIKNFNIADLPCEKHSSHVDLEEDFSYFDNL